jgi:hypothetical protein
MWPSAQLWCRSIRRSRRFYRAPRSGDGPLVWHSLAVISEARPDTHDYSGAISAPNYLDWAHQNTVSERIAAVTSGGLTLSAQPPNRCMSTGACSRCRTLMCSGSAPPSVERLHATRTNRPRRMSSCSVTGSGPTQFAWGLAVIGKCVHLDGELYTVNGVMPAGTGLDLLDPELWTQQA